LKYFKRYNHYKYLKKVILTRDQRHALKKISNFKMDYQTIYKHSNKDYYKEEDRDLKIIFSGLKKDIIDHRIKELIDLF